jgi:dCTP diphosphatase
MVSPDRLEQLLENIRAFVRERDWDQYHDPKNLTMAVASEAGELSAVLRWVHNDEADERAKSTHRGALEAEVADVAICLLMLCDRVGIDLVRAAHAKLERNREKYPVERVRGKADTPSA